MKNRHGLATRIFVLIIFMSGTFMDTQTMQAADRKTLDSGLDTIVEGTISGSPELSGLQLLLIRDGQVVYEYSGGFAHIDDDGGVPLMRLVEAGEVDLDQDVSTYLGFVLRNPQFPDQKITLRMILSHTSSIRDGDRYWLEEGQRFEDFFLSGRPFFDDGAHFAMDAEQAPGCYYTYSNLNFGVVAAVIERVSGTRFDRYMRSEVLEPLGLKASYNVCDLSEDYPDQIATLYRKRGDDEIWQPGGAWVPQLDDQRFSCHYGRTPVGRGENPGVILPGYTMGENPTLFSPQGGLRASARDLSVIGRMLLAGGRFNGIEVLGEQSVAEMFSPQWHFDQERCNGDTTEGQDPDNQDLFRSYGLSVHRADLEEWGLTESPRLLHGHLGEAYGLLGQFWLDIENGDALISLVTGTGDDPGRHMGVSPLYRPSEEIMRWWLKHFPR
jgi:CubicO group peptidase (beta-lactamase class C family)